MRIPIYHVDAFTSRLFAGNPAAVCPLDRWLDDATLQSIGAENNLPETAFFVPEGEGYRLRWFTPAVEIDLCGHATLASAYVVFRFLDPARESVVFESRSGPLGVRRAGDLLEMDFPARPPGAVEVSPALLPALGGPQPVEVLAARDYLVVYETEEQVRGLAPDFAALRRADRFAVIATAPGTGGADFVSRFFAPAQGIDEDPVTGSAHSTLVPYWSRRLDKKRLEARQVSARGGELACEDRGGRVAMAGRAVLFMQGTILLGEE